MRAADSVSNGRSACRRADNMVAHFGRSGWLPKTNVPTALPRPETVVGEIMVQIIQRVGGGLLVCINIDYSCHVET